MLNGFPSPNSGNAHKFFSSLSSGETGPKPCQGKEGQQGQTLPLTGQRRANEDNVEIKVCPKLREAEGYADYILESV